MYPVTNASGVSTCTLCLADCLSCVDGTTCAFCEPTKFFDSGACGGAVTPGIANCLAYSSAIICTKCAVGKKLNLQNAANTCTTICATGASECDS